MFPSLIYGSTVCCELWDNVIFGRSWISRGYTKRALVYLNKDFPILMLHGRHSGPVISEELKPHIDRSSDFLQEVHIKIYLRNHQVFKYWKPPKIFFLITWGLNTSVSKPNSTQHNQFQPITSIVLKDRLPELGKRACLCALWGE